MVPAPRALEDTEHHEKEDDAEIRWKPSTLGVASKGEKDGRKITALTGGTCDKRVVCPHLSSELHQISRSYAG